MQPTHLYVTDTSATDSSGVRKHHVPLNGEMVEVSFTYGKPTKIPYELAVKFLIPGFIVEDGEGRNVGAPPQTNDAVRFQINDDEVVAKLDELTTMALQIRAIARVGGEIFVGEEDGVNRDELITFLKTNTDLADEDDDAELEDEDGLPADTESDVFVEASPKSDEALEDFDEEPAPATAQADPSASEGGNKEETPEDTNKEA